MRKLKNFQKMILRFLFTLILVQFSMGVEQIRKAAEEAKCKGMDISIAEDQMMVILECAQELGVMSKEDLTKETMPCFSKCLLEKRGLIDTSAKVHKEKIVEMLDSSIPEALAVEVKKHLTQCLDDHGPKLKPNDETCKSFEPLTTCVHESFIHLCT